MISTYTYLLGGEGVLKHLGKNFGLYFILFFIVYSQDDPFNTIRQQLEQGEYFSAAKVEGPSLILTFPESAEAHQLYAHALYLIGDYDSAQAILDQLDSLEQEPSGRSAWLKGLISSANGNLNEARQALELALSLEPSYNIAMDLAKVSWLQGNISASLEHYQEASRLSPEEPWPQLNMGRLFLYQQNYSKAITALDQTLTRLDQQPQSNLEFPSPIYAECYYLLAEAYWQLDEKAKALSNYQASLSVDPNYLPAIDALQRSFD